MGPYLRYPYTQFHICTWCQKILKTSRRETSEWLKSPNMTQISTDCLMPGLGHFYPIMQNSNLLRYLYIQFQIEDMCLYCFSAPSYHHVLGWPVHKFIFYHLLSNLLNFYQLFSSLMAWYDSLSDCQKLSIYCKCMASNNIDKNWWNIIFGTIQPYTWW